MPDTYLVLSISFDLAFYPNSWVHMLSRSFPPTSHPTRCTDPALLEQGHRVRKRS